MRIFSRPSLLALLCCVGLSSSAFRPPAPEPDLPVFVRFMELFFEPAPKDPSDEQKVDLSLKSRTRDYMGRETDGYACQHCNYISPTYILQRSLEAISEPGDNGIYLDQGLGDTVVGKRFESIFGVKPIAKTLALAGRNYQNVPKRFYYHNPEAVKAYFAKMYRKPEGTFRGLAMRSIYKATIEGVVRDCARIIARTLKDKRLLSFTVEYLDQAQKNPEFDGVVFCGEWGNKFLPSDNHQKDYPCIGRYAKKIPGIVARRSIDGSLPAVLQCLATMLRDYDPTFYTEVQDVIK